MQEQMQPERHTRIRHRPKGRPAPPPDVPGFPPGFPDIDFDLEKHDKGE